MFAFPFYLVVLAASFVSSLSTDDVLWSSPADGSVYHSGDTLTAVWRPSLSQGGGSPSFSLCDQTDNCGSAVWPAVRNSDDGFKEASFIVPDITSGATFHLEMEDDFGNISSSPEFTLNPAAPAPNQPKPEASLVDPVNGPAQLPFTGLASHDPAVQDEPLSKSLPSSDSDSWLPVSALSSSSSTGITSPETLPSSPRPWFNTASVFPDLPGGSLDEDAALPGQKLDKPRDRVDPHASKPSSSLSNPPPTTGGTAAIAPPMSQVHFPPSTDTTPTPLAPHSQLSAKPHTTPLPIAAIAVPLSFAAVIGLVAFAAVTYNRRKALRIEAQTAAATKAINGNMKLLEARNTSFWSRSSAYSSGPSTPSTPIDGRDQEKTTVLGRLTARWAPSAPPPAVHEDSPRQSEDQVDALAVLPEQKFDDIPLSPAMPPPLHIRNHTSTAGDLSRLTTSSVESVSPVDSSFAMPKPGGLYDAVSKAFGSRHD